VQGVFACPAKMDLDFIDCVSYLLCDGGAWGLDCGSLIFQWHTPFGLLVFGNKKPPMLFVQQRRLGLLVLLLGYG